ncbi:unnamed protein product [marine sediment metagenome]|uniref:Uncharacterized protein n=1 Tax=marine sediment metagenome TaxID=412755 RepID=X0VKB9_9ZZZZ
MIDTKEIESRVERYMKRKDYEPLGGIAHECVDHIESQAEEIEHLTAIVDRFTETERQRISGIEDGYGWWCEDCEQFVDIYHGSTCPGEVVNRPIDYALAKQKPSCQK